MLTNLSRKVCITKGDILFLRLLSKVSSKKFHQVAQKMDKDDIIYPLFEDNILTKYLTTQKNNEQDYLNKLKESTKYNKNSLSSRQSLKIKGVNYQQILTRSPRGSILQKQYKQAQLCLMGMNYTHTSYQNIYKTLIKFQPDCILIQNRPQLFIQQFQQIKKDPNTTVFSDKLYIQQLDITKNSKLIKTKFSSQQGKKMLQQRIFPRRSKHKDSNSNKSIFPNLQTDLVQQKPLLTSIYHSLFNKTKPTSIFLSQLPQRISRQWICNSNSLMQLQQIYKQTCKSLPLYPGTNITPYQLACYMFPQQFLSVNDKYTATLVQVMLALGYKRVMMFNGVGENQAVWEILDKSIHTDKQGNILPIIQSLIPPQVKGSLIRDYDPLELIQKHILLDSLYWGQDLKNIPINRFTITNQIISHYAKQEPKQMLFKFRYQMCMKVCEVRWREKKEGIHAGSNETVIQRLYKKSDQRSQFILFDNRKANEIQIQKIERLVD